MIYPKKFAIADFRESQLNDQLASKKRKVGRPKKNKNEEKADNCENVFILSKKEHKVGKGKKYNYL
jgi:hypothetical protein